MLGDSLEYGRQRYRYGVEEIARAAAAGLRRDQMKHDDFAELMARQPLERRRSLREEILRVSQSHSPAAAHSERSLARPVLALAVPGRSCAVWAGNDSARFERAEVAQVRRAQAERFPLAVRMVLAEQRAWLDQLLPAAHPTTTVPLPGPTPAPHANAPAKPSQSELPVRPMTFRITHPSSRSKAGSAHPRGILPRWASFR